MRKFLLLLVIIICLLSCALFREFYREYSWRSPQAKPKPTLTPTPDNDMITYSGYEDAVLDMPNPARCGIVLFLHRGTGHFQAMADDRVLINTIGPYEGILNVEPATLSIKASDDWTVAFCKELVDE